MAVYAADVPEEDELKSLTEDSVGSFGQAVRDKDFSTFYEDIAAIWKKETTAEKLKEAFKDFLDKEIDLPSVLEELDPVFEPAAAINADGLLVIKGYYPTKPNKVRFELKYVQEEDEWKLVGISVKLKE